MKRQKKDLPEIIQKDDELWTTSVQVAERFGKRHNDVLRDIRNLECPEEFRLRNFAQSSYLNQQGKIQPMYLISEDGFLYISLGFTGKEAALIRVKFIEAFRLMQRTIRRLLRQERRRAEKEWIAARQEGKIERRNETDAIKELEEYAKSQGSTNYKHYYSIYTNMQNSALFFVDEAINPKNLRDWLDKDQLTNVKFLDVVVARELRKDMARKLHYKAIYPLVKEKAIAFGELIGKTVVMAGDRLLPKPG